MSDLPLPHAPSSLGTKYTLHFPSRCLEPTQPFPPERGGWRSCTPGATGAGASQAGHKHRQHTGPGTDTPALGGSPRPISTGSENLGVGCGAGRPSPQQVAFYKDLPFLSTS